MSFLHFNTCWYLIPSFCGPHSVEVFPLFKSAKGKLYILAAGILSGASFRNGCWDKPVTFNDVHSLSHDPVHQDHVRSLPPFRQGDPAQFLQTALVVLGLYA